MSGGLYDALDKEPEEDAGADSTESNAPGALAVFGTHAEISVG